MKRIATYLVGALLAVLFFVAFFALVTWLCAGMSAEIALERR